MAQSKILLDSNCYFRLARSIHPLLFRQFGAECYCLYVLPELQAEYDREPRLQNRFPWVNEPEFRNNRIQRLTLSRKQQADRPTVFEFMWEHVTTELPGPSKVDVTALSYGYVLGIPVVTDDIDMCDLAKVFGVRVMTTLELLRLMLDAGHIDLAKVRQIAAYWAYEDDRPAHFSLDYKGLFGEPAP